MRVRHRLRGLQLTPRLITPGLPEMKHAADELRPLRAETKKLNDQFDKASTKEEKAEVVGQLKALAAKQKAPDTEIKEKGESVQLFQEMGGLIGRILLAVFCHRGHQSRNVAEAVPNPRPHFLAANVLPAVPARWLCLHAGLWNLRPGHRCSVQLLRRILAQSLSVAFARHRR